MCGISGFSGVPYKARSRLVMMLGMGIDDRGGDAAGYVGVLNGKAVSRKRLGHWIAARDSFLYGAAVSDTCAMHARFRTSGSTGIDGAHPFQIARGAYTIHGMHNGCIYNAYESAAANGRDISVDSEEIFHLLADDDREGMQALEGYGVIQWHDSRFPTRIFIARLSDHSDLYVAHIKGGGTVWGSTQHIVKDACDYAGLKIRASVTVDDVGRAYYVDPSGVYSTKADGIRVGDRPKYTAASSVIDEWDYYMRERSDDEYYAKLFEDM